MDQALREGPRVEEMLKGWRTAYRALAAATAARERIAAAQRLEARDGPSPELTALPYSSGAVVGSAPAIDRDATLSAAVLAERTAMAAEQAAHQRFIEARERAMDRVLRVGGRTESSRWPDGPRHDPGWTTLRYGPGGDEGVG